MVQGIIFYDYAYFKDTQGRRFIGEIAEESEVKSAGLGLRLQLKEHFQFQIDYAGRLHQLKIAMHLEEPILLPSLSFN